MGQKKWAHRLMTIILSNLNRLKKIFTGRFLGKFAVKWILKIPPHLAYAATLLVKLYCQQNKPLATNYNVVGLLVSKLRKVYC